jgi:guanine nucleotide-binding protein subunit alpha
MVNLLTARSEDTTDPLSRVLAPPTNETSEQCAAREAKEAEARRVSERIDEQIRSEKQANSRNRAPVKVLMLGQAESGAPPLLLPIVLLFYRRDPFSVLSIQGSRRR